MSRWRVPFVCGILLVLASVVERGLARADDLPLPTAIRGSLAADASSVAVRVTVTNRSDRPTDAATLDVYLSADGLIDPGDARLDVRPIAPLGPHAESVLDVSAPVPDVPPGRYYVVARLRATDGSATPPSIRHTLWGAPLAIGPDLVVDELDGRLEDGGTLRVAGRVTNAGTRTAGPVRVSASLAEHATGALTGVLGAAEVGSLTRGQTTRFETVVPLSDIPSGRYRLVVQVDPDHRITESDLTNNVARGEREYLLGPDLSIAALSAVLAEPDSLAVQDTVVNRGTRAAAPCGISFFLSRNGMLDPNDVPIGYRVVPALAPGADSRAETRLVLPRGRLTTGRYYLLGKVDSSGAVAESDETNNVGLAATPLDLRFGP
ncbi:MAG: hypothetical protein HY207_00905 [Nitrospirae bacterium]|nr:hypothetical protein [Nitrospirota bacterium]